MARVAYFNGEFVPESAAKVSLYDSALQVGDMAFEVTRTFRQRLFRLSEHLQRLSHTLSALRIDCGLTPGELVEISQEVLRRNVPGEAEDMDWSLVHNISRGPVPPFVDDLPSELCRPTVIVSAYPLLHRLAHLAEAFERGLDLVVPEQRSIPGSILDASLKTRSRVHFQLANLQAAAIQKGSSAVLVDPEGFVTEGTSGNVFLVRDGRLCTPELGNILPGVTRGVILDLARRMGIAVAELAIHQDEVPSAEEIFVTSTSIGILHGRSWRGHPVGDSSMGKITNQLRRAFSAETGVDVAEQARDYANRISGGESRAKSNR